MSNEIKEIKDEELENVVGGVKKGGKPNNGGNDKDVSGKFVNMPITSEQELILSTDAAKLTDEAQKNLTCAP